MPTIQVRSLLISLVMSFTGAAFGVTPSPVSVDGGWIRMPAPGAQTTAAYMTLKNETKTALRITGVEVAGAKAAELHETKMNDAASKGGTASMSMMRLAELPLAAAATKQLAPGGLHVMIFGLTKELSEGSTVDLTLILADGTRVATKLKARAQ